MATQKANWMDKVKCVVDQVESARQKAIEAFKEKSEAWDISEAIAWHGADVSRRLEEWRQVKPIADLIAKEDVTPSEKLTRIRTGLAQRRRDVIDSLYLASSTSAFHNAVENVQAEAKVRMFAQGMPLAIIEAIVKGESESA